MAAPKTLKGDKKTKGASEAKGGRHGDAGVVGEGEGEVVVRSEVIDGREVM